jgi:transposase InsO family protein
MGPTPASTVLTAEQEAVAVAFRRHTLLALNDCLYAWQATIPHLSRSARHRCFQRHGVSCLPLTEDGLRVPRNKFKDCPIGYLHVGFAEVQSEEGRQHLFVAIDRTSKVAFAELQPQATKRAAADFLRRVLAKLPYRRVHAVRTDNGVPFGNMRHQPWAFRHIFDRVCAEHGIEHRFTKPGHPWTNGQLERMNRTSKEATVQRYHYQTTAELNEHLQAFLLAYNHAKRLKTLRGLTPHEFVCAQWQKNPVNFNHDPTHLTLGLYT